MERNKLRKIFDAGVECNKQHPDDDSYDEVHFERIINSLSPTVDGEELERLAEKEYPMPENASDSLKLMITNIRNVFIKAFKANGSEGVRWIKVEDELPKMNLVVLVYLAVDDDFGIRTLAYYSDGEWYKGAMLISTKLNRPPSHWQPLPKPPTQ